MVRRLLPALLPLTIFIILAVSVYFQASWIHGLDGIGQTYLRPPRALGNQGFFETVTKLGSTAYLTVFALFASALLWLNRKRRAILPYLVSSILSALLANGLKLVFRRPRPPDGMFHEAGYSFPSGHSTSIVAIYGAAIALACLYLRKGTHKLLVGIILGTAILLVMWSRVYLGVHYLSDVLAGFALGLAQIFIYLSFKGGDEG